MMLGPQFSFLECQPRERKSEVRRNITFSGPRKVPACEVKTHRHQEQPNRDSGAGPDMRRRGLKLEPSLYTSHKPQATSYRQ